jgi:hypothetical protein
MDHPDGKPSLNGTFLRGRLVGYGRAEFADGGVYDGTFKDGKRSGQGRMQYNMSAEGESSEAAIYTGEWRHNLRHGHGEMLWQSDGARYEGMWHMDRRLQGTLRLGSGQASATGAIEYRGEFRDDLFHGRG